MVKTDRKNAKDILLKDIMRFPPLVIRDDEEFSMVEKLLREHKIKHLPVVNDKGKLVGLITLSDLYRTVSPKKNLEDGSFFYEKDVLNKFILGFIMTKSPKTLKAENTLADALKIMVEGNFGCIPVVDGNHRMEGIITQSDIIRNVTPLLI